MYQEDSLAHVGTPVHKEGPNSNLELFTRFEREEKIQGMSEAQAFIALPEFPTALARSEYEIGIIVTASQSGGISSWQETVKHLLRHYATITAIKSGLVELRTTAQKEGEI